MVFLCLNCITVLQCVNLSDMQTFIACAWWFENQWQWSCIHGNSDVVLPVGWEDSITLGSRAKSYWHCEGSSGHTWD